MKRGKRVKSTGGGRQGVHTGGGKGNTDPCFFFFAVVKKSMGDLPKELIGVIKSRLTWREVLKNCTDSKTFNAHRDFQKKSIKSFWSVYFSSAPKEYESCLEYLLSGKFENGEPNRDFVAIVFNLWKSYDLDWSNFLTEEPETMLKNAYIWWLTSPSINKSFGNVLKKYDFDKVDCPRFRTFGEDEVEQIAKFATSYFFPNKKIEKLLEFSLIQMLPPSEITFFEREDEYDSDDEDLKKVLERPLSHFLSEELVTSLNKIAQVGKIKEVIEGMNVQDSYKSKSKSKHSLLVRDYLFSEEAEWIRYFRDMMVKHDIRILHVDVDFVK